MRDGWRLVQLGEVATLDVEKVPVVPGTTYQIAGVLNAGQGMLRRDPIDGSDTNYPALHRLRAGQLVMRKLTAWEGPITIVPEEYDGCVVSTEFPTFSLDPAVLLPGFMQLICQQPQFWEQMRSASTGTVQRRKRVNPSQLLALQILLPPIDEQRRIVDLVGVLDEYSKNTGAVAAAAGTARRALTVQLVGVDNSDWEVLKLGDLIALEYGKALKEADRDGGEYPVFGSGGQCGSHSLALTGPGPSIVVGRKGSAGRVHWHEGPSWPIDTTYYVRLLTGSNPRFLFLLLESLDLPAICAQTGVPGLNRERAYELSVRVPDASEQDRIATLVGAMEAVASSSQQLAQAAAAARGALLISALAGEHEIPKSYDRLLERA